MAFRLRNTPLLSRIGADRAATFRAGWRATVEQSLKGDPS